LFGINVFKVREVSRTPIDHAHAEHAERRRRPDFAARQRDPGAVAGRVMKLADAPEGWAAR
jgi:hypothetical protein